MNTVIHLVAAARPNFMKIAPLWHALTKAAWCRTVLVHTGQHYDVEMSGQFLDELGLPVPDHNLEIGSGSHATQTAGVMVAYEALCLKERPSVTIVAGDVNSTLACAIAAKKLQIDVAHLEAGLRSGDRTMPEEINRIVTDSISDLLWTPSPDADENLLREGVPTTRIDRVGNIMIDSFEMLRDRIAEADVPRELGLAPKGYAVATLHRPANVDTPKTLSAVVDQVLEVAVRIPVVFPVHPRTRSRLNAFRLFDRLNEAKGIRLTAPMGYLRFMNLVTNAAAVMTDSGGIQEETTYLGIPCLTVRDTTERPITVTEGTNRLVAPDCLAEALLAALAAPPRNRKPPDLWDGQTARRVVESLKRFSKG